MQVCILARHCSNAQRMDKSLLIDEDVILDEFEGEALTEKQQRKALLQKE